MLSVYSWITLTLWVGCFGWLALSARSASQEVSVYDQKPLLARIFKVVFLLATFGIIYEPRWFGLAPAVERNSRVLGFLGAIFCATGVTLIALARRALGRNWSDLVLLKENHQLVRTGPYRWIRHPLYTGLLLALLGSALTSENRAGYAIIGFCFVGLLVKSRKEEKLLARQFPMYGEYQRRVRAFVPFVF